MEFDTLDSDVVNDSWLVTDWPNYRKKKKLLYVNIVVLITIISCKGMRYNLIAQGIFFCMSFIFICETDNVI